MAKHFIPPSGLLFCFVLAGCGAHSPGKTESAKAGRDGGSSSLLLLAAASTSWAALEIAAAFEAETGIEAKVPTAASNTLATQVIAGYQGNVFLSADPRWAAELQARGLVSEQTPLLTNQLVLVVPLGNPAGIHSPADLLANGVHHVAIAAEGVPVGSYAEGALRSAGLFERLLAEGRFVHGQNSRLTLGFAESGEAAAAIVYATDAMASDRVEVVHTFNPESHDPIIYPLVLLESPSSGAAARALYDFVRGPAAMAIFRRHGFSPALEGAHRDRAEATPCG